MHGELLRLCLYWCKVLNPEKFLVFITGKFCVGRKVSRSLFMWLSLWSSIWLGALFCCGGSCSVIIIVSRVIVPLLYWVTGINRSCFGLRRYGLSKKMCCGKEFLNPARGWWFGNRVSPFFLFYFQWAVVVAPWDNTVLGPSFCCLRCCSPFPMSALEPLTASSPLKPSASCLNCRLLRETFVIWALPPRIFPWTLEVNSIAYSY